MRELLDKDLEAIAKAFTYHPPKGEKVALYEQLREAYRQLAILVAQTTPDSREKALAMTNLEQSSMWANAAIARHP